MHYLMRCLYNIMFIKQIKCIYIKNYFNIYLIDDYNYSFVAQPMFFFFVFFFAQPMFKALIVGVHFRLVKINFFRKINSLKIKNNNFLNKI